MPQYGAYFERPPISNKMLFGGWVPLAGNSEHIKIAVEETLTHMKSIDVTVPSNINIELIDAGSQTVSGQNTYVQFRIPDIALNIRTILNETYFPVKNKSILKFYATDGELI